MRHPRAPPCGLDNVVTIATQGLVGSEGGRGVKVVDGNSSAEGETAVVRLLRSRGARGARLRRPGSSTSCPGAAWPGRTEESDGVEVAFADAAAFEDWPAGHYTRIEGVARGRREGVGDRVGHGRRTGRRRAVPGLDLRDGAAATGSSAAAARASAGSTGRPVVAGRRREGRRVGAGGPDAGTRPAEVRRAREDGRWDRAYACQATAVVPDDLAAALAADPAARAAFDVLDRTARSLVLLPLLRATTPEARRTRLERGGAGACGERASWAAGAMTRSAGRAPRGPRTARPLG
ncbi:YdeI/OmpD-associated family protein [Streptomyces sp. A1499]|uniref:YdeI/OmpD-associated family protein n=1 Tax=Streptomyces sp. A1499 TaxID=2563104 RepID=UPI001F0D7E41|nr:YdeI/OmpD-associated family protein [Streptomyces sp. A1499]